MGVAPTAFAALRNQKSLAGLGKIEQKLFCLRIKHLRSDRNSYRGVLAVFAETV